MWGNSHRERSVDSSSAKRAGQDNDMDNSISTCHKERTVSLLWKEIDRVLFLYQ